MTFTQLFKAKKKTYFFHILTGIGIFVIYFLIMVNWMAILRNILNIPNLGYDRQPEALKFLNKLSGYLLWMILFVLFIRGILKKNLVVFISVGLGFLFSYLGLLAFLLLSPIVKDYANRRSFDAVQWKNEKLVNSRDPIRIRMVDDLLNKNELIGMSKSGVNDLLGIPPKTGYFSNYDYVYWLGPERGFMSIDSEWLVIKFENNKVVEVKITTD